MHANWTSRLSDYLDDELPAAERGAVDEHLAECASCRGVLVELGAVVARAGALEERPPREELWQGIAARIGARPATPVRRIGGSPARRLVVSIPQLAAAAVVLLVAGGSAGWLAAPMLRDSGGGVAFTVAEAPVAPTADQPAQYVDANDAAVAAVVEELEAVLASGRGQLAPSTIATLETNLAIIDTAIAEARQAVVADPGNAYLQTHLADILRRKVSLLQRAASLASTQT